MDHQHDSSDSGDRSGEQTRGGAQIHDPCTISLSIDDEGI